MISYSLNQTACFLHRDAVVKISYPKFNYTSAEYQVFSSFKVSFQFNDYFKTNCLETLPATCKLMNEDMLMQVKKKQLGVSERSIKAQYILRQIGRENKNQR